MVRSRDRRDIGDRLTICAAGNVLNCGSDTKIVVAIQKIADVRESVAAPAAPGSAGVATR